MSPGYDRPVVTVQRHHFKTTQKGVFKAEACTKASGNTSQALLHVYHVKQKKN